MILVGQYDSPFVRRVGIALTLYGLRYDHRPWSVFADADQLRALNPLMRVPVLVLDDGVVLTDSHFILDYLDGLVADPMVPKAEPQRHRVLQVVALAAGLAEKAVSLFHERRLHPVTSAAWEARCLQQIVAVVQALEADRASRTGPWWFDRMTHADIMVACALRFGVEALPGVIPLNALPHLKTHCDRCEALPAFRQAYQAFDAP